VYIISIFFHLKQFASDILLTMEENSADDNCELSASEFHSDTDNIRNTITQENIPAQKMKDKDSGCVFTVS